MPPPPRTHETRPGLSRLGLWLWLGLLVISLALGSAIAWQILPTTLSLPSIRSRPSVPQSTPQPATAERRRVRLFFPQPSGGTLKELEREIPSGGNLAEDVRAVLRELATGAPGVRPAIPPSAAVRQVFLDAFGILYLDFSREIQALVAAPGAQAEQAISAIVNSLTASFSEVKRVQFLIEGKEMAETAGGWDLRRPLTPRFPGGEKAPVVPRPRQ